MISRRYYPTSKLISLQCGHLSGKVLVPTSTHISRLIAARFQLDLLQNPMLLIARTDAESARLISSSIDPADHPFIRGVSLGKESGGMKGLAETLDEAERKGMSGNEVDMVEKKWMDNVRLVTFDEGLVFSLRI